MDEVMAKALSERADLMEGRAMTLAGKAVEDKAPWLKRLGTPPGIEAVRHRWLHEARTVTAYRDRYQVDGRRFLGEPRSTTQKLDAARTEQAIRRARAIADQATATQIGRRRTVEQQGRVGIGG